MSEFKGTPGVWTASDDEESTATSVISNESGYILCVVGTYMTSAEEDYANANLIAAAPELLEALQDMLSGWKYIRQTHGDLYGVGWDRAEQKATEAIANALGQ